LRCGKQLFSVLLSLSLFGCWDTSERPVERKKESAKKEKKEEGTARERRLQEGRRSVFFFFFLLQQLPSLSNAQSESRSRPVIPPSTCPPLAPIWGDAARASSLAGAESRAKHGRARGAHERGGKRKKKKKMASAEGRKNTPSS